MAQLNYIDLMKTLTETDTQQKEHMGDQRNSLSEITEVMTRNARLLGLCKANEKVVAAHFF